MGLVSVAPLPGHGVSVGALVLLRHAEHPAFTEREEGLGRLFAARAGAAMSAARLYAEQHAITQVLLRELLPPKLVQVRGVEFAGGYRASEDAEQIGGDFYDVHPAADEDGETFALLGDVSGKGLEAAVLTGKIRNTLHALHTMAGNYQQVLELLNATLLSGSGPMRFATVVLASARRVRPGEDASLKDITAISPTAGGAAGEMISSGRDLNRFFDALIQGRLLYPAELREMQRTRPTGSDDGRRYGLGMESRPLPCGGVYWGHTGDFPGFETAGGATAQGRRASIMVNLGPGSSDAQSDDMRAALETALCADRPGT
ncbi:SpoIIE family protein phosphatase [Streptomyces rubiginosohelvolus]|uniref:SpoIIE family protein phosphatase n=1 Tax=Streptomyces rubiginosohelvolus TaxID=67362 RepID=UPI0034194AB7